MRFGPNLGTFIFTVYNVSTLKKNGSVKKCFEFMPYLPRRGTSQGILICSALPTVPAKNTHNAIWLACRGL